jgi:hypothetical protein
MHNVKTDVGEIVLYVIDWIRLDKWKVLENTEINLQFPE